MKAKYFTKFAAVLAAVALSGCIGRAKQPEVKLSEIRVAGIGLRGASFIAALEISNPNDVTLETDSISYMFEASDASGTGAWSQVTRGTYAQRIQVRDNSRTQVEIPLSFNYSDMSGALRSILDKGTFNYRVSGQAYLREPLHKTIPFTKTGNLSLQGAR
ncbi:MAG TPA: LEA type 2 family protein [Longimicrobiales bacterium]